MAAELYAPQPDSRLVRKEDMLNSVFLTAVFIAVLILLLGISIADIAAEWRVFNKAGDHGWKVLIPFYNLYMEFKLFWQRKWFLLYLVLSIGMFIFAGIASSPLTYYLTLALFIIIIGMDYYLYYMMSLSFGWGGAFALGLLCIEPVFMMILGFGQSKYKRLEFKTLQQIFGSR